MKRIIKAAVFLSIVCLISLPVLAQEITTIAEINQVDADGNPTFPGLQTTDHYTIEGRAINAPGVFNGVNDSGVLDTSFILYVQDDTGGIQVYSGAWYGGGLTVYPDLQPGDLVKVTGLTGSFGGKTNINERHNPDQKFTINLANAPRVEPTPMSIESLAGLGDFDQTRQTGAEYYQGRLVVFKNVTITDGEWGVGATMTVSDAQGNTFPVELRAGTGIGDNLQPQGPLDIVGVFNQEDSEAPFTEGYMLWPRSIDDFQPAGGASAVDLWDVYE